MEEEYRGPHRSLNKLVLFPESIGPASMGSTNCGLKIFRAKPTFVVTCTDDFLSLFLEQYKNNHVHSTDIVFDIINNRELIKYTRGCA